MISLWVTLWVVLCEKNQLELTLKSDGLAESPAPSHHHQENEGPLAKTESAVDARKRKNREQAARWRNLHPNKNKEQVAAWRIKNKEAYLAKLNDPIEIEKRKARFKERMKDPEVRAKRNKRMSAYSKKRLAQNAKAKRKWIAKNRESHQAWMRDYDNRRRREDSQYALGVRLRNRMRTALKESGVKKSARTSELIGCSFDEFQAHLESTFQPGMSWDRRSEIEIDHVVPISAFDLTDPEQQKKAFHFSNTQALWTFQNRTKGARVPEFACA